jgi:hypothetical protein
MLSTGCLLLGLAGSVRVGTAAPSDRTYVVGNPLPGSGGEISYEGEWFDVYSEPVIPFSLPTPHSRRAAPQLR